MFAGTFKNKKKLTHRHKSGTLIFGGIVHDIGRERLFSEVMYKNLKIINPEGGD